MSKLSSDEIWRQIPPEEKFELLAKSQASGIQGALVLIITLATIAVGLKIKWLLWASFICSPLVYQFAAGKAWRKIKPGVMLEYLAARSVARRFAYISKAADLTPQVIFRAAVTEELNDSQNAINEAIQAIEKANERSLMWISLLNSAVVAFFEAPQGARLEFVSLINEQVKIEGRNLDESDGDYSANRELLLTIYADSPKERKYRITSPYPAALVVFEKRLIQLKELAKIQAQFLLEQSDAEAAELNDPLALSF